MTNRHLPWAPRTTAAGLLASLAFAIGAWFIPAPAHAATTLPKVQADNNGWTGMSTRPGAIYVGNGCAPYVNHLAWGSWTASGATTRAGTLHQCGAGRTVSVYLHDVLSHNGTKYFAKMRWTWTARSGAHRVEYWVFRTAGGTVPFWNVS